MGSCYYVAPEVTAVGLCSCLHRSAQLSFRVTIGIRMGFIYMCCQVLRRDYGVEADMWSLGVMLYILLSGLPPFWGDKEEDIFRMVLKVRSPDMLHDALAITFARLQLQSYIFEMLLFNGLHVPRQCLRRQTWTSRRRPGRPYRRRPRTACASCSMLRPRPAPQRPSCCRCCEPLTPFDI